MNFPTQVSGIPCLCQVLSYSPERPMIITGSGFGDAEPPEPEDFDFELLDLNGRPARWLEKKLTEEDYYRLLKEYKSQCEDTQGP